MDTPGVSRGTANVVTPASVSASTTNRSAAEPEVMNAFSPFSAQPSPSRRALVSSVRMSLPWAVSVSA